MEALNIEQEYREYVAQTKDGANLGLDNFVANNVSGGYWVEDDGDYYTADEWDEQWKDDEPPTCGCGARHWEHTEDYASDDSEDPFDYPEEASGQFLNRLSGWVGF